MIEVRENETKDEIGSNAFILSNLDDNSVSICIVEASKNFFGVFACFVFRMKKNTAKV